MRKFKTNNKRKNGYSRRKFINSFGLSGAGVALTGLNLPEVKEKSAKFRKSQDKSDEITSMSATKIAEMIRNKEVSSEECVKTYFDRIDLVNPEINAVVMMARERAMMEAKKADEKMAKGEIMGPLHGVPMTIKDSLDTKGIVSTGGTLGRKDFIPGKDATVVARLRDAGAILMGKTNTPEFTLSGRTSNLIYGQTRNPYDTEYQPSGSSGGAAAIVAAGGSPFDIGSDYGGSVRAPAHVCGIAGIKPTTGRVPRTGHIVNYEGVFGPYQQLGPLTRKVEDLITLLPIISGPDGIDPFIHPAPMGNPDNVNIADLKVAYYEDNGITTPIGNIRELVRDCATYMEEGGAKVTQDKPGKLKEANEIRDALRTSDGRAYVKRLVKENGTEVTSPNLSMEGEEVPSHEFTKMVEEMDAVRSDMLYFMQNYDIILCPVMSRAADPVVGEGEEDTWYTSVYNTTGWPAAVVRACTAPNGLPLGIQIVGRPWQDDVVLAVAKYLESQTGGWQAPALT